MFLQPIDYQEQRENINPEIEKVFRPRTACVKASVGIIFRRE